MLGLGAVCALSSCAYVATAADPEVEGRALFEKGVSSYENGQYTVAIAAFREAYRITKRPGLLFSLAQAFRRSYERSHEPAQLREAIQYYARYLETSANGVHRTEAARWLQQLGAPRSAPSGKEPPRADRGRAQLVIAVNAPNAKLTLDGSVITSLPHAADVAPGTHHLEASAEGYAAYQQDVDVPPDAVLPISIHLVPSTSRIQVLGVRGSEVLIDGVLVGQLPSEGFSVAPGRHRVEVRQRGYYTLRQTIESDPGAPRTLELRAEPTTRRTASWVLVGAGAAVTLAGGVLGYLALRKQADAQSLQDQPGMGPAFERALEARNDLRLAAAATAGLGGAMSIAGLLSIVTEGFGPAPSSNRANAALSVVGASWCGTF